MLSIQLVRSSELSHQFDQPSETSRNVNGDSGVWNSQFQVSTEEVYCNVYETSAQNANTKCKRKIAIRLFIPKSQYQNAITSIAILVQLH